MLLKCHLFFFLIISCEYLIATININSVLFDDVVFLTPLALSLDINYANLHPNFKLLESWFLAIEVR